MPQIMMKRCAGFCCIGRKHLFIPTTSNSLRGQRHLHRFLPTLSHKRNRNRLRDLGFVCMFPPAHRLTQPKDLNAVSRIAYVTKGLCVGSLLLHLEPLLQFWWTYTYTAYVTKGFCVGSLLFPLRVGVGVTPVRSRSRSRSRSWSWSWPWSWDLISLTGGLRDSLRVANVALGGSRIPKRFATPHKDAGKKHRPVSDQGFMRWFAVATSCTLPLFGAHIHSDVPVPGYTYLEPTTSHHIWTTCRRYVDDLWIIYGRCTDYI